MEYTLQTLAAAWLKENGYDGLFNDGLFNVVGECACKLDDLMPCGEPGTECQPGYLAPCKNEEWCGGDCAFHIAADKPATGE